MLMQKEYQEYKPERRDLEMSEILRLISFAFTFRCYTAIHVIRAIC